MSEYAKNIQTIEDVWKKRIELRDGGERMIGAKCDLCGIPIGATESLNVFRMWNGVRVVQIEDVGLQGIPYDENFCVCDECMDKAYDMLMKIKVVGE